MVWFAAARVLFVAALSYAAVILKPLPVNVFLNAAFGAALGVAAIAFARHLRETPPTRVLGALLGALTGLVLARGVQAGLVWLDNDNRQIEFLDSAVLIVLPYFGIVLGLKHSEWLEAARLVRLFHGAAPLRRNRILDTSVIIDGRIADVCETGFLDGTLVIPQFVLKELQLV